MDQRARAKKAEAVKARFRQSGITVAAWARAHGFPAQSVYNVLNQPERRGARSGISHRIAVLLGLKAGDLVANPADLNAVPAPRSLRQGVSRGARP